MTGRYLHARTLLVRQPVPPALSVLSCFRATEALRKATATPVAEEMGHMGPHPDLFDKLRVVTADGELDLTTVRAFARDLEDARHGSGPVFLIVDLRAVTFMDGSALGPLCAAREDCCDRLGWVRVVHDRPSTALLFRAAGLLERFPRYASPQDAWQDVPADRAMAQRPA
ncbi:STAS domain-containing protein [Streptomyces sp. NBC_01451]|uniref:STAS domain-containing protein n=1 Tax=Streptomyces sp. NBC_01451 TaxID=2903872 RepID=UPI002E2F64CB|nr:STAS domain-containing protein [Streptomyces sp. NBC_01451]